MDDRIHQHAETLVDWSARVESGEHVVVSAAEGAHDLAVAVAQKLGERGATVMTTYASSEVQRAYLTDHSGEFHTSEPRRAMYEAADVLLRIGGGRNTSAAADVPSDTIAAYSEANEAISEARRTCRWMSTVHPTRSLAQQAGMSIEAYRDFVYDAILRDWEALAEEMAQMKDVLDDGSEVRLRSEDTDLTMRIDDRTAVNSCASVEYDSHNLPSGEVFTAPFATEGEVLFDVPMTIRGQRVRDVRLTFDDGEVVDVAAAQGQSVIEEVVGMDDGSRRLGELGVGMNRGIDRITDNILFDEKMGGTVHLALGRAYDANMPEGESGNESSTHVDLITDLRDGGELLVDGEVIQRDGVFRWEDGFE